MNRCMDIISCLRCQKSIYKMAICTSNISTVKLELGEIHTYFILQIC